MDRLAEFEILKQEYNEIEIPKELDYAISMGIDQGKKKLNKENNARSIMTVCASVAVAFAIFTTAINVSPSFADIVDDIPIIGELVKILRFVDGKASGGEITDGVDISGISVIDEVDSDIFVFNFEDSSIPKDNMGFYKVVYTENPGVMSLEIYGARMISAKQDFKKIMKSEYVKDIYTLMTLDDSLIRFNIVFNENVTYDVQELKNPASLVIEVKGGEKSNADEIYSVRTYSYPISESFGRIEEDLMDYEELIGYRILRDNKKDYLIELSIFETKEEAEAFKTKLEETLDIKLLVECREPYSDIQHIED